MRNNIVPQYTVDDFLDHIGLGPYQLSAFFFSGLGWIFDGIENSLVGFIIPELKKEFKITPLDEGLVGSVVFLGMGIGAFLGGTVSDSIGRKFVFVTSVLFCSIFATLSAFSNFFMIFLFFRFFVGFFLGILVPNDFTFFFEITPKKHRGLLGGLLSLFFVAGNIITDLNAWLLVAIWQKSVFEKYLSWFSPIIPIYQIIQQRWRFFIIFTSIPALLLALLRQILFWESPRFYLSKNSKNSKIKALEILRKIAIFNRKFERIFNFCNFFNFLFSKRIQKNLIFHPEIEDFIEKNELNFILVRKQPKKQRFVLENVEKNVKPSENETKPLIDNTDTANTLTNQNYSDENNQSKLEIATISNDEEMSVSRLSILENEEMNFENFEEKEFEEKEEKQLFLSTENLNFKNFDEKEDLNSKISPTLSPIVSSKQIEELDNESIVFNNSTTIQNSNFVGFSNKKSTKKPKSEFFKNFLKEAFRKKDICISTVALSLIAFGLSLGTWGFLYLVPLLFDQLHKNSHKTMKESFNFFEDSEKYVNSLLVYSVGFLGQFVAALTVDLLPRQWFLLISFVVTGINTAICLLIPNNLVILILAMGVNFFMSFSWCCLNIYVPEVFISKYRVTGTGIVNAAQRLAGVLTPMIGTVLIHQNLILPYLIFGISLIICAIITLFLPFETRGQKLLENSDDFSKLSNSLINRAFFGLKRTFEKLILAKKSQKKTRK